MFGSNCGGCGGPYNGDGLSATLTFMSDPAGLALDAEGNLYLADEDNRRIRRVGVDGVMTTVAGTGSALFSGDNGPPTQAGLTNPADVALGPDGSLYLATVAGNNTSGDRVRRVRPILPGFAGLDDFIIPAKDGREVYVFTSRGKHLRTVNPLTGSLLYEFGYDSMRRLATVTDANNNVTTIQRDANGKATGITGPYNQTNSLTLDANGYLKSLTNPKGEQTQFSYTSDGLLTSVTPPSPPAATFQYDTDGRLQHATDPAGGSATLSRSSLTNGYQVQHTTAEGTQTTYQVEFLPDGQQRRTNLRPDGTQQRTVIGTDGSQTLTQPDGMGQSVVQGPDPRFGLLSPTPTALNVTTPGGKTGALTSSRGDLV